MARNKRDRVDHTAAARIIRQEWDDVVAAAEDNPDANFVKQVSLRRAISQSINHSQVSYRYCLPIQVLGKVVNPQVDSRRLQRGADEADPRTWDARSLGARVIAPFIKEQESVLGTSGDPYVGNPMRIPQMMRDDKSKSDVKGWNRLLDVLDAVEDRNKPAFTKLIFRQVLLEIYRRQRTLRFTYSIPPRVSLKAVLQICETFVAQKSGGDRALALAGALFDVIGNQFGLFAQTNRARINASDQAVGQVADLECIDTAGKVIIAVEVKDRALTLTDVDGTILKTRNRDIEEIFFAAPKVATTEEGDVAARIDSAFATGQNLYVFDFAALAAPVLALGGNLSRRLFLERVGDHLDTWTTQPSHRQAWKKLLEAL